MVDGKTYIEVSELKEILDNLERLGPALQQVADATAQIKRVFSDSKPEVDNLLVELKEAAGNPEGI